MQTRLLCTHMITILFCIYKCLHKRFVSSKLNRLLRKTAANVMLHEFIQWFLKSKETLCKVISVAGLELII